MKTFQEAPSLPSRDSDTCVWWNIQQAAEYLGVSVAFLRKSVRLGRVPYARAGSKVLRFRRIELDRWLESNGRGGEASYRKQ